MSTNKQTLKPALDSIENQKGRQQILDLRSDTVTKPGPGMYDAMMSAPLGDDVYQDDESVNALEANVAHLLAKEAAIFVSSGTQGNLIAILGHCGRGDELIVGDQYHIYGDEAGGPSVLGGVAICPLQTDENGGLQVEQVEAAIKSDDVHNPISRLLCLENTVHGNAQNPQQMQRLSAFAQSRKLSSHLDGARLMNATVALGVSAAELAEPFDSVSLCLSKGLGAPVGTVLAGNSEFIRKARRNRKLLGGGMRQAGILAAAGSYALQNNVERLVDDHRRAEVLAEGLRLLPQLEIRQQTNMVFIRAPQQQLAALSDYLAQQGVLVGGTAAFIRIVVHLDISSQDIDRAIVVITQFFKY